MKYAILQGKGKISMTKDVYYSKLSMKEWSFYVAASHTGLCFIGSSPADKEELLQWVEKNRQDTVLKEDASVLSPYITQLEEYLTRKRKLFTLPTDVQGTLFQKQVWRELSKIPYGKTTTYGAIAQSLGKSISAARSVGTAVGKNPLMIVYPCHRVVPKNGQPRGFRGGLKMKHQLLTLETA